MSPQASCPFKDPYKDLYTFSRTRSEPKALDYFKKQTLGVYPPSMALPDLRVKLLLNSPASAELEALSPKPCPFRESPHIPTELCISSPRRSLPL